MRSRLVIVEGLPCSGKSGISAYIASALSARHKVCFVDEGTGNHPADYEFHALAPAGMLSDKEEIISLADYSGEMFDRLLRYKIYDFLPWETEKPLMLDKWKRFAAGADPGTVYVFNCVLLQNPMCETMMRFGFPEETSLEYISEIAGIIAGMDPAVIYLKTGDIAASVRSASEEREGWLDQVIAYHVGGAYGKSIRAEGFEGYIACLKERQERELRILNRLPVRGFIAEDPRRDWASAKEKILEFLLAG